MQGEQGIRGHENVECVVVDLVRAGPHAPPPSVQGHQSTIGSSIVDAEAAEASAALTTLLLL